MQAGRHHRLFRHQGGTVGSGNSRHGESDIRSSRGGYVVETAPADLQPESQAAAITLAVDEFVTVGRQRHSLRPQSAERSALVPAPDQQSVRR